MRADPIKPANLSKRGKALWAELVKPGATTERKVVVAEACRLADRLDAYDTILSDGVTESMNATAYTAMTTEARLTAGTLQRILLGLGDAPAVAKRGDAPPPDGQTAGTIHDEVATRRASRQANATG